MYVTGKENKMSQAVIKFYVIACVLMALGFEYKHWSLRIAYHF